MRTRKKAKRQKSLKDFKPLLAKLPEGIRDRHMLDFNPEGQEKMSGVLLDFLDPLLERCETQDEFENLINFGITAWNATFMSPDELKECVDQALGDLPFLKRWRAKAALKKMMRRKEQYFAENRRIILDYHLRMTKDGPHVSVVSTISPGEE